MQDPDALFTIPPEEIPEYGAKTLKAGLVPLFLGEPGIGKSTQARLLAALLAGDDRTVVNGNPKKKKEYGFWPTVLGNHEAIDISLPYLYGEGDMKKQGRAMMDIMPEIGPGLWSIDEAGQNPDMFRIIAQIVWDRRLNNDYFVPDDVHIILLSNRAEDRAGSSKMYTHLLNRLVTMTVKPTTQGFLEHNKGIVCPEIAATLTWFPELLSTFDPKSTHAFASCRSWMMLNAMMVDDLNPLKYRPLVNGTIGPRAGAEFNTICKVQQDLPDIDALLANPDKHSETIADLANKPTLMCALSIVLSKRTMRDPTVFDGAVQLMERISEERAVSFVRLATITTEDVMDQPAYGAFVARHTGMFF